MAKTQGEDRVLPISGARHINTTVIDSDYLSKLKPV
jgi:hypothetical protein